jgi:SAM-dependent methyltransferase
LGIKSNHHLIQCDSCATIATETSPSADELGALYDHYYDGARFEPRPVVASALDRLAGSFRWYRATNRWLDLGFGGGGMLAAAERQGWSCHGVEVAPAALRHGAARGWTVSDNPVDSRFPAAGFDVVTMVEVIEHVAEPDALLESAARLLRPGGLLFVTTPNAQSLNRRLLGQAWSVVAPPEHLTLWSAAGLCQSLARAGFTPVRIRTDGFNPSELRARIRRPRPDAPALDRNAAAIALNEALSRGPVRRGVKALINQGLTVLRAGDRLKVWAILKQEPREP